MLIVNYPNKVKNNYVLTEVDNLYFLEVDTLSLNNGTHFSNEVDDKYLCEIMKTAKRRHPTGIEYRLV